MTPDELKSLIRTVPDFPTAGIQFRDITTLIGDGQGLAASVRRLADRAQECEAQAIAGMEARGFIFGAAVAVELGVGFVPVLKPGKLPIETIGIDYALEYGTDRLEIDPGAISPGQNVVIVDDLIATGGTALAAIRLIQTMGGDLVGCSFIVDLPALGGAQRIRDAGHKVHALCDFEGE